MRYPQFEKQGFCTSTGVVESGCKIVVGTRLKRTGMHWTVKGANAIIALRCSKLSGRFRISGNAAPSEGRWLHDFPKSDVRPAGARGVDGRQYHRRPRPCLSCFVYGAVIAPAPPYSPPCIACATASILAASDRFIAVQFDSDDLWVYDKVVRKWRSQPMPSQPTTQSQSPFYRDPRIFGVWLAGADTPDGALQLRSLLTGQTIDLPAAANGGEVLAINHMGTILYKSNDSLFSVSLKNEQLGAPVLLATSLDSHVRELS